METMKEATMCVTLFAVKFNSSRRLAVTEARLLLLLLLSAAVVNPAQSQQDIIKETTTAGGSGAADVSKVGKGRDAMEEEVLGPLRIWHIVFIVGTVITIAVTVVFCCIECRIPRTRQEIEETYRVRQMNQKYLHQLERTPDVLLRPSDKEPTSHTGDTAATMGELAKRSRPGISGKDHHHVHPKPSHHYQEQQQQHQHQQQKQHHHHQQQRRHNDPGSSGRGERGSEEQISVAVTDTSARMAKLAKSQMYGVQTPFSMSAITALQKQRLQGASAARGRGGGEGGGGHSRHGQR